MAVGAPAVQECAKEGKKKEGTEKGRRRGAVGRTAEVAAGITPRHRSRSSSPHCRPLNSGQPNTVSVQFWTMKFRQAWRERLFAVKGFYFDRNTSNSSSIQSRSKLYVKGQDEKRTNTEQRVCNLLDFECLTMTYIRLFECFGKKYLLSAHYSRRRRRGVVGVQDAVRGRIPIFCIIALARPGQPAAAAAAARARPPLPPFFLLFPGAPQWARARTARQPCLNSTESVRRFFSLSAEPGGQQGKRRERGSKRRPSPKRIRPTAVHSSTLSRRVQSTSTKRPLKDPECDSFNWLARWFKSKLLLKYYSEGVLVR